MSGYYTISNTDGFVAVSATNTLEQIADGTADAAIWMLLQKTYWEDIVNIFVPMITSNQSQQRRTAKGKLHLTFSKV